MYISIKYNKDGAASIKSAHIALWCNGSTRNSSLLGLGPNPSGVTKQI